MRKYEKKIFAKNAACNTDFFDCVDDIFADSNLLLALDLGNTANEGIYHILENVHTMNVIYNTLIKFLLKECA